MQIKYLMDENLPPIYQIQLRRKEPDLVVWAIDHPSLDDEYRDRLQVTLRKELDSAEITALT
ncbi:MULTISPECIES: hypothetical protein [Pseudanabaena]|jgi:hypothetical protein|uniref:hypothetical protein n=1 Tax=Pseudanabaena TaxID=1152 RepID=UPI00247872C3|nr:MULTISPECIES: hypothetical protein [Pseudanabaena]MEA5488285.1 hypothetical protein [Pseudanabaena sp. CCNP1317]WGS72887.1 hypothetical protein OA858_02345 [Pseudanabaena galeata CCNP1313]